MIMITSLQCSGFTDINRMTASWIELSKGSRYSIVILVGLCVVCMYIHMDEVLPSK